MDRCLLDIEDRQVELLEERNQGPQRQVREVLVVDRIVLEPVVEVAEVRRLEDEDPVADIVTDGSEDGLEIVNVREDIRPCDEVRAGQTFHRAAERIA